MMKQASSLNQSKLYSLNNSTTLSNPYYLSLVRMYLDTETCSLTQLQKVDDLGSKEHQDNTELPSLNCQFLV
jgi:hypothetical protein